MAVYEAIPARFGVVHPRYKTPGFATIIMGVTAIGFYLILSIISTNALADSIASLGLAVAFYYGITAIACVVYFRKTLFTNARNFFLRGLLPLLGGLSAWRPPSSSRRSHTSTRSTPRPPSGRSAASSSSVSACWSSGCR